jgi:hypothetical protein
VWEPSLFVAVPLVIAFFSFLFCVCALVGLLTRSTIAALIITAIFWFMLFAVNTSEQALLMFRTYNEQRVQAYDAQIEQERQRMQAVSGEASNGIMNALKDGLLTREGRESRIARLEERREEVDRLRRGVTKWHNGVFIAKTILPKTTETVQLTERTLVDMAELDMMMDDNGPDQNMPESREDRDLGVRIDNDDVTRELIRKQRSRSVAWIVGTSLLFEAFILAIACWVFCRRDY